MKNVDTISFSRSQPLVGKLEKWPIIAFCIDWISCGTKRDAILLHFIKTFFKMKQFIHQNLFQNYPSFWLTILKSHLDENHLKINLSQSSWNLHGWNTLWYKGRTIRKNRRWRGGDNSPQKIPAQKCSWKKILKNFLHTIVPRNKYPAQNFFCPPPPSFCNGPSIILLVTHWNIILKFERKMLCIYVQGLVLMMSYTQPKAIKKP